MDKKIREIKKECAEYHSVSTKDMMGDRKYPEISEARQVFCYIVREALGLSYRRTAMALNRTDHTFAMYGYRKAYYFMYPEDLKYADENLIDFVEYMIMKYKNTKSNRAYKQEINK